MYHLDREKGPYQKCGSEVVGLAQGADTVPTLAGLLGGRCLLFCSEAEEPEMLSFGS